MRMGAALVALGELAVGGVGQNCDVRPGIMPTACANYSSGVFSHGAGRSLAPLNRRRFIVDYI
jgi:hypothetical protein